MKTRAPRNRTLTCTDAEIARYSVALLCLSEAASVASLTDRIINQDFCLARPFLPEGFVDLLILDPPYNLTKNYNGHIFRSKEAEAYTSWFDDVAASLLPFLRPAASVYVCSDWRTSNLVFPVLDKYLHVRNRITWEREKGRGAKANWKNNTEDIWFCTVSEDYYFNVEAVKLKRRVIAPYRFDDGEPKDWEETQNGNYRLTYPSNLWSDITIPFWSMPENTDHPTQKPEKLMAKLLLASSRPNDFVFDPFLGSGTSAVVAKKLHRRFCGIEIHREYCCWAAKRLQQTEDDSTIQGYSDGVFWERNSLNDQAPHKRGSFNGSDIVRGFEGISNSSANISRLYDIHAEIGFDGNLARLVEATNNISPSGTKFKVGHEATSSILEAPKRAKRFIDSKDYAVLKGALDA